MAEAMFKLYNDSLKLHRCMHCSFKFDDRDEARAHMFAAHEDYHCSICSKGFFLERALNQHMGNSKHSGNVKRKVKRPKNKITQKKSGFECTTCGKYLRTAYGCSCHMKDMHHTEAIASTKSSFPGILCGASVGETLDEFMKRKVWPTEMYKSKSKQLVMQLKTFMEHNTGLNVKKVFVGGSQGKKTNLLDNSDVDLVVYINDHQNMSEFQKEVGEHLEKLKNHMMNDLNWADKVTVCGTTNHAVQFKVTLPGYKPIHVDLLPALDILDTRTRDEVYEEMKNKSKAEREYYSVCFSQGQTEFVKNVPSDVKSLIRLVKYWKNSEEVPAKSYFLELLVVYSWRQWGEPAFIENSVFKERFKEIIKSLTNLSEMRIVWKDRYTANNNSMNPVLLDCMNPYNNVAPSGEEIRKVESKAKVLLNQM